MTRFLRELVRECRGPQVAAVLWAAGLCGCTARAHAPVAHPVPGPRPVVLEDAAPASVITITNNYPFAVREPIRFPVSLPAGTDQGRYRVAADARDAPQLPLQLQEEGGRTLAWFEVELGPGESRRYTVRRAADELPALEVGIVGQFPSGLPASIRLPGGAALPLFDLSLVELTGELDAFAQRREERIRSALQAGRGGSITFREVGRSAGPIMSELRYRGEGGELNRYRVEVVYRVFGSGTVDAEIEVLTQQVREPRAYVALAKHLVTRGAPQEAVIRWHGKIMTVQPGRASPPRTERAHSWGRDVSWVALGGADNRAILARFTPGLTRLHDGKIRNVNDFFVNEYLLGMEDRWVLLAEIAREKGMGMGSYLPLDFVVPSPADTVRLHYRLLPPVDRRAETVDDAFTSFAGYQGARRDGEAFHVDLGVDGVSFGTSYFPHSTFAENFEFWRTADMEGRFRPVDRWWPLFPHWRFFREEIRRDMRIANAMGLEWIRIHHFDAPDFREDHLATPEGRWMLEYMEFMAQTARETGLRLYLDFSLSPNDAALLAERFGDVIAVWEVQNESLIIPGASPDRFDYWREVRRRILAKRPEALVLWTGGPQFYSIYDHLAREKVASDGVGQHAYVDAHEPPEHFRDIAVSLGGYATRTGRVPVNSEYNWRMITRESEEAQAQRFAEISEHLLSPRAIPLVLQFQFQETFTTPPRTRGALRHYELLRVDRTPKPQADVFVEMVKRYGRRDNRLRQLAVELEQVNLEPGQRFGYTVRLRNLTARTLEISAVAHLPAGFEHETGEAKLRLGPGEERVLERRGTAPAGLAPGVYHFFEELRYGSGPHFGWGIARYQANPRLELTAPVAAGVRYLGGVEMLADLDLSSFSQVVFGADAPALEVDWALYLYHSLRSATGADIRRARDIEIDHAARGASLILVGSAESNRLVAEIVERLPVDPRALRAGEGLVAAVRNPFGGPGTVLLVTGRDAEGVQRAAADFLYRYWRYAKDAVSFREGMPPVEGTLLTANAASPAAVAGSIVLRGPQTVAAGEAFRVTALDQAEPPGPVPGLVLSVRLGGEEVASIRTGPSGEASLRLDRAGLYEIRPAGADGAPIRVRVTN